MFDFLAKFLGRSSSGATAKERLRLVLLSDHLSLAPDVVDALKHDLIEMISRYVEVDVEHCDVTFEHREKEVAMLANIPILGMHKRPTPTPPSSPTPPPPPERAPEPPPAGSLEPVSAMTVGGAYGAAPATVSAPVTAAATTSYAAAPSQRESASGPEGTSVPETSPATTPEPVAAAPVEPVEPTELTPAPSAAAPSASRSSANGSGKANRRRRRKAPGGIANGAAKAG